MSSTPVINGESTFTPVHPFNLEDPKSWAETVGKLDWDETHIVFTKRSFLEMLQHAGVTVGTHYKELQKLPKFATFGKISQEATDAAVADLVDAEIADPKRDDDDDEGGVIPRPSRKVAQPPGGASSIQFAEYEHTDALSLAPPHPRSKEGRAAAAAAKKNGDNVDKDDEPEVTFTHTERFETGVMQPSGEAFKPTRKVRENPGGKSTLGSTLFGGDD